MWHNLKKKKGPKEKQIYIFWETVFLNVKLSDVYIIIINIIILSFGFQMEF